MSRFKQISPNFILGVGLSMVMMSCAYSVKHSEDHAKNLKVHQNQSQTPNQNQNQNQSSGPSLKLDLNDSLCEVSQRLPSMGSVIEICLVVPCVAGVTTDFFVKIQQQLDAIESEVSLYQPQSPLSQLNRDGVIANQYPHLLKLLKIGIDAHEKTNGAFDISIHPVLLDIRESFKKQKRPPLPAQLEKLRPLIDVKAISIAQDKISYLKKGMAITFDGIAKGYAVDEIAKQLEAQKIKNYLINFSGNMRWSGHRKDLQSWKIVMWNPVLQTTFPFEFLQAGAIASSGPEINYYSEDKKWHHLIDPKTLRPAGYWSQTTIVGKSAQDCDILSTSTFVSSAEQIKKFMSRSYPQGQVWGIDFKGQVHRIH